MSMNAQEAELSHLQHVFELLESVQVCMLVHTHDGLLLGHDALLRRSACFLTVEAQQ
jgi:hypothetical protein